ncbi:hypothetical protein RJ640_005313 [Escallonia rubra]|uniref:RING-type domain-containing protein n=1 Tax=Escallonia rubra TaxID=112253 RepID=A0AA88QLS1_9ASTE|nr:hypothetical protein RJ640_005313 [Escallonia rubra]
MAYDSIANASIPTAANAKDFAKKKRANRSAKLKQSKLDARREQWLSQVKNKGSKEEMNGGGGMHVPRNERERSMENFVINPRREDNDGSMNHYSDSDSPSNSPTSHSSSVLGSNASGTNFTGSSSSRSSSSSSSVGCYSGTISEDDDGDDGCSDDWEAVADALAATDDKQEQHNPVSESSPEREHVTQLDSHQESTNISKPNPICVGMAVHRAPVSSRAWRPDDAFRPQSLPNLLKQHSFPMNSDRHYGRGGTAWACKNVVSAPTACPICCEDLDLTDSSFLPCSCGFRLCLFCHKRILEEDGRCPGCRKQYDFDDAVEGEATLDGGCLTVRLARSCSMITRS